MKYFKKGSAVAFISVLACTGLVLSGCGSGGGESGSESKTVNVTLANHTWTTAITERIPEFEEKTGIKVNLTTYGEDQLSDQYNVKLNASTKDIDVMMYRPLQEGKVFANNKWLAPLGDKIESNPDWDWKDFQPGPVEAVTADGTVHGVPLVTEREILYYRTDLLEAAGLKVPETMEELEAAAAKLHDPDAGIFGFVARGERAAAVTQFSSYLYSFGGDWDDNGTASVGSDAAKQAYTYYGSLLRNYGPPGITNASWPEAVAIFVQGKAAFYTDADSLYANMTDKSRSVVEETTGYAQFPAGPAGSKPYNIPAWGLGINSFSENQDNAWKFIEWATSKEMTIEMQIAGIPLARSSGWDDPKGTEGFPPQLVEVIQASGKVGVGYDRPRVVKVSEARDIVGKPIVISIEGGDVNKTADEAQVSYQDFLDNEKP